MEDIIYYMNSQSSQWLDTLVAILLCLVMKRNMNKNLLRIIIAYSE